MSQYLNNMKVGDNIDVRGPSGRLKYLGGGRFSLKVLRKDPPRIVSVTQVAMIAGNFERIIEIICYYELRCFLWFSPPCMESVKFNLPTKV